MDSADEREAEAEVTCCLQKEFQKADPRPFATADAKDGGGASRCFGAVKLMNRRLVGLQARLQWSSLPPAETPICAFTHITQVVQRSHASQPQM